MSEILIMGLMAIAVVVVLAGVLGRLVAHDDLSASMDS
jgi:TRAP-type C4-dicarboxylate transport system permease small subunit